MTEFQIPASALPPAPTGCPSTAPDNWTVGCELEPGHDGLHRNNMVTWSEPQIVFVGGEEPDLTVDTDHWQGGEVVLSTDLHGTEAA